MVWNSKAKKKMAVEDGCGRRVAVFAGSFDPFTVGHFDLVKRAAGIFDSLIVLVAQNASKKNFFDAETRKAMVEAAVSGFSNVSVKVHSGLTVDFMKSVGAHYLVRGIRNSADLEAEQAAAWNNKVIYGGNGVETVLLLSAQEHLVVSSTLVRELLKCGANRSATEQKSLISKYVPRNMVSMLLKEYRKVYETV